MVATNSSGKDAQSWGRIPDARTAGSSQPGRMAAAARIRVILDVEPDADAITGVAMVSNGPSRAFCGWTPLADAVAAALGSIEEGLADRG